MKPHIVTLILSAAAAAGYLGYRAFFPGSIDGSGGVTAPPAASQAELVATLPDFVLDDLDGHPTPITSWPGKPLVVNFWATWCAPCLREIPLLKAYQDDHPSLQVIGIAIDRVEPVVTFAADMQFNYPVLVGPQAMNAAGAFGVDLIAMPFTVFTGADGSVLGVHTGELHPEHLQNFSAVVEGLRTGGLEIDAARARLAGSM